VRTRTLRRVVLLIAVLAGSLAAAQDSSAGVWLPDSLKEWLPGLERIHAGDEAGFDWILKLHRERPEDACGYYLAVQGYLNYELGSPDEEERNEVGRELLDQGLDLDEAPPEDLASRFCRGAMHGVRAEQRVKQGSYVGAAFDGKKMRRIMLDLIGERPDFADCKFWLGTYNYYAAVLPKYIKFFRTLLFLPAGDRDQGIAYLEESTRESIVERYNAHWVLSYVYDEQKRPEDKRTLLQEFHAAYPDDVGAANALARDHASAEPHETEQGVEVLQRFIDRIEAVERSGVDPRLVDARYALGRIYARSYDYENALPELRQALELGRDDEGQELRVGQRLISTLNLAGLHTEAVELFRALEQRYPEASAQEDLNREAFKYDEASSRLALALVPAKRLVREGKIAEAEARYKELLREHDEDAQIHLFMAEMYFQEEQWSRSEARFNKVAQLAPETPTFAILFTKIRLGQIYDLTDRRGAAKKHYRIVRDTAGPYKSYVRAAEYYLKNRYSNE